MTPCNNTCKLNKGRCLGCGRDKNTIAAWADMQHKERLRWIMAHKWSCRQCGGEYYDHEHRCVRCGGVMIYKGEK